MIFCVAGDPGGSRAVLPVALALAREGEKIVVPAHGFLGRELPPELAGCLCDVNDAEHQLAQCQAFVWGSSTNDMYPLYLAHKARDLHIPVMHILDNWSNYRQRLCMDNFPLLIPDIYTVIDEAARRGAIAEGIPEHCLVTIGHPGLSATASALGMFPRKVPTFSDTMPRLDIAFINEPFSAVFGKSLDAPTHPGFTEETVLTAFLAALQPRAAELYVHIVPHPKDSPEAVRELWNEKRGLLQGTVVNFAQGRDVLPLVRGVAGMASILLYEAWLKGMPVLSLQPNCKLGSLRYFATLDNILYTDKLSHIATYAETWLALSRKTEQPTPRPELLMHKAAPTKAAAVLLNFLSGKKL